MARTCARGFAVLRLAPVMEIECPFLRRTDRVTLHLKLEIHGYIRCVWRRPREHRAGEVGYYVSKKMFSTNSTGGDQVALENPMHAALLGHQTRNGIALGVVGVGMETTRASGYGHPAGGHLATRTCCLRA